MLVKKRILVIDDEQDICNSSKSVLERTEKFEVLVSTDALTGINLAKSNNPDLILLDVNMPDMDGGEVAQQLRDYKATSEIPIIFLTALLRKEETGEDPGKIGRHFFMAKPVLAKELIDKIESVLKINNR
jgi:two-component system alkaline phosphatase synthesis response regulator PhoP